MRETDLVRLRHMRDAASKAVEIGGGRSADELARDRLIHGYFDVDLEIVAATLRDDLPPLVATLDETLS